MGCTTLSCPDLGRSSLGNKRKAAWQLPWASRSSLLGIGSGLPLALALSICFPGGLGGVEDPWRALRKTLRGVWREPDLSSWADPHAARGPVAGGQTYTWLHGGCAGLKPGSQWRALSLVNSPAFTLLLLMWEAEPKVEAPHCVLSRPHEGLLWRPSSLSLPCSLRKRNLQTHGVLFLLTESILPYVA